MACILCKEKDKLIADKDKQLTRILKGYKGDKQAYRMEERNYQIAIASLVSVIVIMSIGVDNFLKLWQAIKDFI